MFINKNQTTVGGKNLSYGKIELKKNKLGKILLHLFDIV